MNKQNSIQKAPKTDRLISARLSLMLFLLIWTSCESSINIYPQGIAPRYSFRFAQSVTQRHHPTQWSGNVQLIYNVSWRHSGLQRHVADSAVEELCSLRVVAGCF
jgi:hypothetical protein